MTPVRMCCVCRERHEKNELLRVVKDGAGLKLDSAQKMQGRGAYICKNAECVGQAKKRRAFERAFSCKVEDSFFAELERAVNENSL